MNVESLLSSLEWLAKYGFIDIIFGIGITGLVVRGLRRYLPKKLDSLLVGVQPIKISVSESPAKHIDALKISLSNTSQSNVYIARAFFKNYFRSLGRFASDLSFSASATKSASHDAYELKFGENKTQFDVLIKPGEMQETFLLLSKPAEESTITNKRSGTVVLEYATAGKSGVHKVRV